MDFFNSETVFAFSSIPLASTEDEWAKHFHTLRRFWVQDDLTLKDVRERVEKLASLPGGLRFCLIRSTYYRLTIWQQSSVRERMQAVGVPQEPFGGNLAVRGIRGS
jgi:hypothetical protein